MTTALLQSSTQLDQRVVLEGVTWQTYQGSVLVSMAKKLIDFRRFTVDGNLHNKLGSLPWSRNTTDMTVVIFHYNLIANG